MRGNPWTEEFRKEYHRQYSKKYYLDNKQKHLERSEAWAKANPESRKKTRRESRKRNKSKNDVTRKIYLEKNKAAVKAKHLEWISKNRKRMTDRMLVRLMERYNTEPEFRIKCLARTSVARVIKYGAKKKCRSLDYLGCTPEQARRHIESLWIPGMSWENHSLYGWHIDHIRPLASFDFTKTEQIFAALHYTNLQPLWAKDNLAKKDKIL